MTTDPTVKDWSQVLADAGVGEPGPVVLTPTRPTFSPFCVNLQWATAVVDAFVGVSLMVHGEWSYGIQCVITSLFIVLLALMMRRANRRDAILYCDIQRAVGEYFRDLSGISRSR